jgi:hypothetical protein
MLVQCTAPVGVSVTKIIMRPHTSSCAAGNTGSPSIDMYARRYVPAPPSVAKRIDCVPEYALVPSTVTAAMFSETTHGASGSLPSTSSSKSSHSSAAAQSPGAGPLSDEPLPSTPDDDSTAPVDAVVASVEPPSSDEAALVVDVAALVELDGPDEPEPVSSMPPPPSPPQARATAHANGVRRAPSLGFIARERNSRAPCCDR